MYPLSCVRAGKLRLGHDVFRAQLDQEQVRPVVLHPDRVPVPIGIKPNHTRADGGRSQHQSQQTEDRT